MIYCFIEDESLHARPTGAYVESDKDVGYGYMTDTTKSYFVNAATLNDLRSTRVTIDSAVSTFQMKLQYDAGKDVPLSYFDNIPQEEIDKLFNIIEAASMNIVAQDSIETLLTDSDALFGVYVPNSITLSPTQGVGLNFYPSTSAAAVTANVNDWITFEVVLGEQVQAVKCWYSRDKFLADYPHTTFTHVSYPDDPATLLSGDYALPLQTLSDGSAYAFSSMNDPVADTNNTGTVLFTSEYNPHGEPKESNPEVTFVVFYKGPKPYTQAIRRYIRTDLLARGLAGIETWRPILPDLFTEGRYFIVPVWDRYTDLPEGVVLRHAILSHSRARRIATTVFPLADNTFIPDHLEIFTSPASQMVLLGLPDIDNDLEFMSLEDAHPTYQSIDGSNAHFAFQEVNTQDFNISLSAAIAKLTGATNNVILGEDEFYGRIWTTFVSDYKEYHVLHNEEYPLDY